MYFWCICGEEGDLHALLLCILKVPDNFLLPRNALCLLSDLNCIRVNCFIKHLGRFTVLQSGLSLVKNSLLILIRGYCFVLVFYLFVWFGFIYLSFVGGKQSQISFLPPIPTSSLVFKKRSILSFFYVLEPLD